MMKMRISRRKAADRTGQTSMMATMKTRDHWTMTICLATMTMKSFQRTLWLSTSGSDALERSTADNFLEHHDENSTMKISTLEMMTAGWIVRVTTQLRRSKRCKSRRKLSWILSSPDKQGQSPATAKYVSV
jgi:hypothetical protein